MNLYDRLKLCKLPHLFMRNYLTDIQSTSDSLVSCGHPIEEIQQISIILNGVKGQFDHIVVVIHTNQNPYDIYFICYVLLDTETRQRNLLFDVPPSINVVSNNVMDQSVYDSDTSSTGYIAAHQSAARPKSSNQVHTQPLPAQAQNQRESPPYNARGRGRGRGRNNEENKDQ